jgi:hypothetical protein
MIMRRHTHSNSVKEGGFLPSTEQQLLITIILGDKDEALSAWAAWTAATNFDSLDPGSLRMMPMVYTTLHAYGLDDERITKCRGIYKAYWYKDHLLIHRAADVIRKLSDAGIPVILHKGIALCVSYYKEIGLRPVNDVDLLLKPGDVLRAARILQDMGYRSIPPRFKELHEGILSIRHSRNFCSRDGMDIDLNWHALKECCGEHDDDEFWRDSVPAELDGVQLRVLHPADLFLTSVIHGLKWDTIPPFRWIVDAHTILQYHRNNFDWDRVIMHVGKHQLCLRLKHAAKVLRDIGRIRIPDDVVQRIHNLPVEQYEYAEYKYICEPQNFKLLPYTAPLWYNAYRVKKTSNPLRILGQFIHDAFVSWNWKWDVMPVLTFEKCIKFVRIIQNL